MRDIKFATVFPKYHPRAGEPTHFIEKIWAAGFAPSGWPEFQNNFPDAVDYYYGPGYITGHHHPKTTTIRASNHWKEGDWFQPKAWSGLPYRSKPYAFAPPLQIKKDQPFLIIKGEFIMNEKALSLSDLEEIASHDGSDNTDDFECWFNLNPGQEFKGQRITFV